MPRKPSSDVDELYSSTETKSCFDDQVDAVRVKLLCCAIYRPAEVERKLSEHTEVFKANYTHNTKCWHCTYPFDGKRWAVPTSSTQSCTYGSIGHFCSPSCAAYSIFICHHHNMSQFLAWLHLIASQEGITQFTLAPPAHWLVDSGGNLTIDEFRQLGSPCTVCTEKTLAFISTPIVLERWNGTILTEATEIKRQVKAQNKRATANAMNNNKELTTRGLYDEFLHKFQKNEKLSEANLQNENKNNLKNLDTKVKIISVRKKKNCHKRRRKITQTQ